MLVIYVVHEHHTWATNIIDCVSSLKTNIAPADTMRTNSQELGCQARFSSYSKPIFVIDTSFLSVLFNT